MWARCFFAIPNNQFSNTSAVITTSAGVSCAAVTAAVSGWSPMMIAAIDAPRSRASTRANAVDNDSDGVCSTSGTPNAAAARASKLRLPVPV
jgi:lipoprotein